MIENAVFLTGEDAELLSRALSEVKTKFYEESETSLDDSEALEELVSFFRGSGREKEEKEPRQKQASSLRKCLVLGTIIGRQAEGQPYEQIAARLNE